MAGVYQVVQLLPPAKCLISNCATWGTRTGLNILLVLRNILSRKVAVHIVGGVPWGGGRWWSGKKSTLSCYAGCCCVCLQALMVPPPHFPVFNNHGDIEETLRACPQAEQVPPCGACWGPIQTGSSKGVAERGVAFLRAMGGTTHARAQLEPMATLAVKWQSCFICVYYH